MGRRVRRAWLMAFPAEISSPARKVLAKTLCSVEVIVGICDHMPMARTQTLIQLSDELLAQLDARAAREQRNRSELVREAISAYLTSDPEAEIDARIVHGYTEHPQDATDAAWADAGTRAMLHAAGPWGDAE